GVFPKIIDENTWPPHLEDSLGVWDIFNIQQPKPLSPYAYCAALSNIPDRGFTKWLFRTEGEAYFDNELTATGPMCHEFFLRPLGSDDPYSLGGVSLKIRGPANFDPFKNLGNDCSPLTNNGSNPINAATGNKYQEETDYSPQAGPTFSRYYNSFASGFGPDFQMIKVWSTNYDSYIRIQTYPESYSYGSVFIYRPNGNIFIFNPDENGGYISENTRNFDKLELLEEGGWRLTIDDDNSIENYDESGKLISKTDRS